MEGKTRREVIRCLKRYVAREVYRLIQQDRRDPEAHTGSATHITAGRDPAVRVT